MKRLVPLLLAALAGLAHADTKISALPGAGPLAGTESIPAVQSGATVATTPAGINTYVQANTPTVTVAKGGTGATTLTGPLKGNGTSALSVAAAADIYGLWSGSCSISTFLRGDGACATPPAGTVTSVALTAPTGLTVTGSPVTSSGTLALSTTLNGPLRGDGSGFTTGFIALDTEVSGILPAANGGSGVATLTGILLGNGASPFSSATAANVYGLWSGSCSVSTFLRGDGACAAVPQGTVTSVALTAPTGLTVTGSPVTGSGTLALSTVLNGPVRGNGSGFVTGNTALGSEVSGTLPVANGGTGATTLTGLLLGNGTSAFSAYAGTTCTNQFLRSLSAAGTGTCATVSLTADIIGTLAVGNGGTGLTSGTSGGIPYFSGSTTLASSAALTSQALVYGGGAGVAPATDADLKWNSTTNIMTLGSSGTPGGITSPVSRIDTINADTVTMDGAGFWNFETALNTSVGAQFTNTSTGTSGQMALSISNDTSEAMTIGLTSEEFVGTAWTNGPSGPVAWMGQIGNLDTLLVCGASGAACGDIDINGNFVWRLTAGATNDTNGFLYVPKVAGLPTGVPAHLTGIYAGAAPYRIDSTNNQTCYYTAAWHCAPMLDTTTVTWTGTGTTTFGGIVSAPRVSVTSSSSPSVGIYRPGSNRLGLACNGVECGEFDATGQFIITIVGKGLSVKEGSNAKMGVSTLVAGTVVVSTTAVTASSRIFLTEQTLGTVAVPSALGVSARTAGTSFTILASAPTDTSTVAWMLVEPSP